MYYYLQKLSEIKKLLSFSILVTISISCQINSKNSMLPQSNTPYSDEKESINEVEYFNNNNITDKINNNSIKKESINEVEYFNNNNITDKINNNSIKNIDFKNLELLPSQYPYPNFEQYYETMVKFLIYDAYHSKKLFYNSFPGIKVKSINFKNSQKNIIHIKLQQSSNLENFINTGEYCLILKNKNNQDIHENLNIFSKNRWLVISSNILSKKLTLKLDQKEKNKLLKIKQPQKEDLNNLIIKPIWKYQQFINKEKGLKQLKLSFTKNKYKQQKFATNHCSKDICNLVLGNTNYSNFNTPLLKYTPKEYKKLNFKLNASQASALEKALCFPISFILGAPGTGKSHTIATIAINFLLGLGKTYNYKHIIVATQSNSACDNIIIKTNHILSSLNLKNIDTEKVLTRMLSKTKEITKNYSLSVPENLLFHNKIHKYIEISNDDKLKVLHNKYLNNSITENELSNYYEKIESLESQILTETKILFITNSSAQDHRLRKTLIPCVIFDEAAQNTDLDLISVISKGTKQIIFCGDPNQLGPICKFDKLINKNFNISLIEKINLIDVNYRKNIPTTLLNIQYRMHPFLSKFPFYNFYKNYSIVDGPYIDYDNYEYNKLDESFWKEEEKPCLFITHLGKETKSIKCGSIYNDDEVNILTEVIKKFISLQVKPEQIGVITFYTAQKNKLKGKLNELIETSTVDGFQGKEKDYIIISLVRSNNKNEIGFISDPKRFNVAITRAKHGIVIVGNSNCFINSKNKNWINFINYYNKNNLFITMDEFNELNKKKNKTQPNTFIVFL